MPATRKMSTEASQQDLDQMKNLFGGSSITAGPAPRTQNRVETVEKSPESSINNAKKIETVASEGKQTTDTTVGIRMTTQKKREMKAYFIQKGTTLSQRVLDAYNLLRKMENEGLVSFKDGELVRV